jgi:hypothetical protein
MDMKVYISSLKWKIEFKFEINVLKKIIIIK